jgi:hypothetical protein
MPITLNMLASCILAINIESGLECNDYGYYFLRMHYWLLYILKFIFAWKSYAKVVRFDTFIALYTYLVF